MTPEAFVASLLAAVRESAAVAVDYFAAPPVAEPPAHLGQFSAWFRQLSPADQRVVREAIQYIAEGSLFVALTHLDNLAALTDAGGELELSWVGPNGRRVRLNDPDGTLLTDLFNADTQPDAASDTD